jgi:hypothetical protein
MVDALRMVRVLFVILCLWASCGIAFCQEESADWGDGDDDAGFADTAAVDVSTNAEKSAFQLGGFVRSRAGFWLERLSDDALSTARQSLDLEAKYQGDTWRMVASIHGEYDLAYAMDSAQYDDATNEAYTWRLFNDDQYLALRFHKLDVTLGRQTVAWGEGDVFSPLDIVNPRDLREPGLADLDDLRLSILATQIAYAFPLGRLEFIVTHEGYFGEQPPPLSEYSPLRRVLGGDPEIRQFLESRDVRYIHTQSRFAADAGSAYLRWLTKGEGFDLGIYGAWLRDIQGVVVTPEGLELLDNALASGLPISTLSGVAPVVLELELDHRRYSLAGVSLGMVFGPWVTKGELVATHDKPLNTGDAQGQIPNIGMAEADVVTAMLGASYAGFKDSIIGLEAQKSVLVNGPDDLLFKIDVPQFALRISRTFLRARLRLDMAGTAMGYVAEYGWLARGEVNYEVVDALKVGLMFVHFGTGDRENVGLLSGFTEHDQVLLKIRWDFQLM